jgi:dCTP deaminase
MLYLGQTIEWTETDGLMPQIDGRSSYGRFGICFHQTAGKGDIGFHGRWTLEITVPQDTIIRPGEEGVQISYLTVEGDYTPYRGKYQNQSGAVPSRLWKEFQQ